MIRLFSIFLCLLLPGVGVPYCTAQIAAPLRAVPADSVSVEDFFWYGQIHTASNAFPDMTTTTTMLGKKDLKKIDKFTSEWEERYNHLLPTGDVSGEKSLESAVSMVNDSHRLLLATGKSKYADIMERSLLNGVCGWQLSSITDSARLAAQTLVNIPGFAFMEQGHHVYVNLFMRSTVHVVNPDLDVKIETNVSAPWDNQMVFQFLFAGGQEQRMALHIRVPDWLTPEPQLPGYKPFSPKIRYNVIVNGILQRPVIQDGYMVIERTWNDTDFVKVMYPTPILRIQSATSGEAMLQKGPLLYTFLTSPQANALLRRKDPIRSSFDKDRHTNVLSGHFYSETESSIPFTAEPWPLNRDRHETHLSVPFQP